MGKILNKGAEKAKESLGPERPKVPPRKKKPNEGKEARRRKKEQKHEVIKDFFEEEYTDLSSGP